MSGYKLTNEQLEIIESIKNKQSKTIKVVAFAGTGKTSTLVNASNAINGKKLYLAFNKSIAEEARTKFSELTEVKTTHALAYQHIVGKRGYKVKNSYSIYEIKNNYHCSYNEAKHANKCFEKFCNGARDTVKEAISDCDFINDDNEARYYKSISIAEKLFDDMVNKRVAITHSGYLKLFEIELKKGNLTTPFYRLILLDEAQDTNDVTLSIFYLLNAEQRVVVGDRHQQIYSFRGSVNAMDKIDSKVYVLTNSFRFTPEIGAKAAFFLKKFRKERLELKGKASNKTESELYDTAYITRTNARLIQIIHEHMRDGELIKPVRHPESIFGLALNLTYLKEEKLESIDEQYSYLVNFHKNWSYLGDKEKGNYHDILYYIEEDIRDPDDELVKTIKLLRTIPDVKKVYRYALDCFENPDLAHLFATTAHTSKGLEWDRVIIENDFPDWKTITNWFKEKLIKPTAIKEPFEYFASHCREQKYIDELNLYYVSITRGKYRVIDNTDFSLLPDSNSFYDRKICPTIE